MKVSRLEGIDPVTVGSYIAGAGALDCLADELLLSLGGKPKRAALVCDAGIDGSLTVRCARDLVSRGFKVTDYSLPADVDSSNTMYYQQLLQALVNDRIGPSDVVVGLGSAETLSLAGALACTYMGGTNLCLIPMSIDASLVSPFTSYSLRLDDGTEVVRCFKPANCVVADTQLLDDGPSSLSLASARVLQLSLSCATGDCDAHTLAANLSSDGKACFDEVLSELVAPVSQAAGSAISRRDACESRAMASWSWLRLGMPFFDAIRKLSFRGVHCYGDSFSNEGAANMLADGLRFDLFVSLALGYTDEAFCLDVESALVDMGLPPHRICVDEAQILEQMTSCDERGVRGLRMTFPTGPGSTRTTRVHPEELAVHIESFLARNSEGL